MARLLNYHEGREPWVCSRGAWRSIWRSAPRYTIDDRDNDGNGIVRIVTYNPDEPKPQEYGEAEFAFPEDADAYRQFIELEAGA